MIQRLNTEKPIPTGTYLIGCFGEVQIFHIFSLVYLRHVLRPRYRILGYKYYTYIDQLDSIPGSGIIAFRAI